MADREGKGMKKIKKIVLVIGFALLVITGADCGDVDHGNGRDQETPLPVDHAFTNGQSIEGEAPGEQPSGPVITAVEIIPGNLAIQGQILTLNITFSEGDASLTSPNLILQILGQPEYWTFGPDQFGAILGNSAVVRLEVSKYFEPEAYIIHLGLMDDAGNIGNFFSTVLIVIPYVTPEIVKLLPEDGATDVPLNTSIRGIFSNPVVGDPPTLTLTRNGQEVDGSIRLLPNMKGITLTPDGFLLPNTEYVATLTVGELISGVVRTEAHTFTTGDAIPAPDLTGRVYSFILESECIIEPAGAEILFSVVPIPPLLIKTTKFDDVAGEIGSIGAIGEGEPPVQNPLFPLMQFPGESATLINPYFSMGPSVLKFDLFVISGGLIDGEINVYDFSLSGHYSPDGNQFEYGIVTGYIDAEEINEMINDFMKPSIPFDACITLPDACDIDGHIAFRAENLSGLYEPGIENFYDLSVEVNPESIVAADGGTVTVFGEFMVDGDPSGIHSVDLSATQGTFPGGGPSTTVDTSDGVYSVLLTVPGGLSPGEDITITASADSPIGLLPRSTSLLVE
jgi:hypothetical protein